MSPILILALLFSSCDDGEKAPDNTATVKVSGESIAKASFTGTGEIADQESFTVKTAPKEIPDATDVSIKVSYDGSNYTVDGSFKVPKETDLSDKTDLTWETLADVSTATMNVTKLTLKGSYAESAFTVASGSYTAAKKPVTLKLTSGAIKATGMSSETGAVTTSAAPDSVTGGSVDKASIASSALTVTIGASGADSSVSGTITLAESKTLADLNGLETLVFNNVQIAGAGTKYNMTLTGTAYTGSGDWTITGISFAAAAPTTVTATTIEVTGISSIETFSANAPSADAADAITLTPPEGVTPSTAIKGKLKTDGSVEFSAVSLSAADDTAIKTGWKISASWTNSSTKACTIASADITPTYESASKKLTFDASALTINVAE